MMTLIARLIVVLLCVSPGFGSIPFQNLDFEAGDTSTGVIREGPNGEKLGLVRNWLPGWRLFAGSEEGTSGTIPLNRDPGLDSFTLYDVNYSPWYTPLEGRLGFQAGAPNGGVWKISLLQVGEIPSGTKSLHYKAFRGPWEVRVNGVSLGLNGWSGADTSLTLQDVSVDVSAWAGQEVELKLTQTLSATWSAIDSIRFSADPVIPEPHSLLVACIALVCLYGTLRRRC